MKKTNLFIIVLCIMVLTLTGCGTDKTKILNENMKKIDFTGDLITYQAYYHNIIEYDKQKDSFLEKNRKLFAEYIATVDLGIDMEKVIVTQKDENTINVFVPKAKIINGPNISKEDFDENKFIESSDNLIFKNNIDANDSTNAVMQAQKEMKEAVNKDEELLDLARRRAKIIVEENIRQVIGLSDNAYSITWEYED